MKGFIINPTYRTINDKTYVYLYGKLENGQSFVTINQKDPYFYIETKDLKKAKKQGNFKEEKSTFKTFNNEPVTKIKTNIPSEVPKLRKVFKENNIQCYEADIRYAYRFLFDNNLQGCIEIDGDYDIHETIDRVYKNPEIKPANYNPKLKVLAFDIETNPDSSQLYCISIYTEKEKQVFIHSKKKLKNAISCEDEEEVLEKFKEAIIEIDPDIITGWNCIDFDLKVLQNLFKKYKLKFNLGRDNSNLKLRLQDGFFQSSKADITGRMVLDGLDLLKTSFIKLDDYKLNTAAKKILGDHKLLQGESRHNEIEHLFKSNQQKLVDYNLKDSELAYKIVKKSKTLDLTILRSKITGMPLDRVNSSFSSLDSVYIKEAIKRKLVLPTSEYGEREEKITGGFVMEPKPGIYDYILILDFKSLYPSVIRSFNIDPTTFNKKGEIKAPNGARFKKEEGILPSLIKNIWKERDKAKNNKDELTSYALKILMNSFYGVFASPACRFYNRDLANAITHFSQQTIKLTAKKVEEMGYEVIYSDTDSIFVLSKAKNIKESKLIGNKIQKEINLFHKRYVEKEYGQKSYLELEFEKVYIRCLMPKLRTTEKGAKKRYAGLLENNKIDITGLEFVRADWTEAAKEFQYTLLERIFHKKEIQSYIKTYVKNLTDGKYDNKLIYRKSIRKNLDEYTKTSPPHVKAARKLKTLDSKIIKYVITTDGPEPIQNQKHKLDHKHYIDKQIKPIADAILIFFNTTFDNVLNGNKQTSLFNF